MSFPTPITEADTRTLILLGLPRPYFFSVVPMARVAMADLALDAGAYARDLAAAKIREQADAHGMDVGPLHFVSFDSDELPDAVEFLAFAFPTTTTETITP